MVSNADELTPTPVLSGETPELSDAGPGGDDDGSLEPGESFGLDQDIRNGGDGTATDIDGTMSGPASVSFGQPASALSGHRARHELCQRGPVSRARSLRPRRAGRT